MQLPALPKEFSGRARKNVVDAEIRAARTLGESPIDLKQFFEAYRPTGNLQVLHQYVLPIFLAFAKETCAMSQQGDRPWYSDHIDRVVRGFLRQLISDAQFRYNLPNFPVVRMTTDFGDIRHEVVSIIEQSEEWKAYQDLLLKVEHAPESGSPRLKRERVGYRKEVLAWMTHQGFDSVEGAARRLGISKSALKSIMSDKGKTRYGADLLKRVLKEIGCQEREG